MALVFAGAPVWCQEGQGLEPSSSGWLAGQWQARIELNHGLGHSSYAAPYNIATHAHGLQGPGLSILGDFFFKSSASGTSSATFSGFRATSGLMVGPRNFGASSAAAALLDGKNSDGGAVPYFGVGYTDLPSRTGWGFSADFGLMAMSPRSAVKLGNVLTGPQSIDDLLRDLRLAPLLQLGVSYSF
ncbi:MAG: hypothetical protein Q7T97_02200 [Burkholderiaceae bacterium]|nr:hypothetical protein [Burkholderiaceae bacterium]